jgi:succinyl-CoA:acetate CoA-transferase
MTLDYQILPNGNLAGRLDSAADAAALIRDGMTVAVGGYTSAGYPKAVPAELARRQAEGEALRLNIISGSLVSQIDEMLAAVIVRRTPMLESQSLRRAANARQMIYVEQQIAKLPRLLRYEAFGRIDLAVIEGLGFTEEGWLVPSSSVGLIPQLAEQAEGLIIEVNQAQPAGLAGLADVYQPGRPPRRPIPLLHPAHRFGEPFVRVDPKKIKAVVLTDQPDQARPSPPLSEPLARAVGHLMNFLELASVRHWRGTLPPVQTGVGQLAGGLVRALGASRFRGLKFFCGLLGEEHLELLASGRAEAASASALQMTARVTEIIRTFGQDIRETLVLRNQEVTNDAETAIRLGLLSINSGLEADIYGNINASHIAGSQVVNGLGGGANFAQNAELSVLVLPSANAERTISHIVPMVPHVDIGEHDVDILVTDQGLADLRGCDEVERAELIITSCAHPAYQDMLRDYLKLALATVGGHHPQLPDEAFAWHRRLKETGTMSL